MKHRPNRDSLYIEPRDPIADFKFDANVAKVFPDMIQRSVPGYAEIVSLIGTLVAQYVQPNTYCYDLGCSLGAVSLSMAERIGQSGCRIIAVDNSPAMLKRCKEIIRESSPGAPIDLLCADILNVDVRCASAVVLNFTLQFIEPLRRIELLKNIYEGLLPGGMLILSEKVTFSDPQQTERFIQLHHAFKKVEGYSDLEISQKRTALEKVLLPESIERHLERLRLVGFSSCEVWFQCLNFTSILALK